MFFRKTGSDPDYAFGLTGAGSGFQISKFPFECIIFIDAQNVSGLGLGKQEHEQDPDSDPDSNSMDQAWTRIRRNWNPYSSMHYA